MSDHLLAILPHSFSSVEDVLRLPEVVRPLTEEANAFERLYLSGTRPDVEAWEWGWWEKEASPQQNWAKYRCAWLDGPLTIWVGAGCLMAQATAKWNWARRERPVLAAAASLFDRAARALGTAYYLGTHSGDARDYVLEGLTIGAIEEKLRARGYVRVATLADLYDAAPHRNDYTHDVYCCVRV